MAAIVTILPPPRGPLPTNGPGRPAPVPLILHIGRSGQDALWAGFVVFSISTLVFAVMASRLHAKHRVFHLLTMSITSIVALSYYAMATRSAVSYVSIGWRTIEGIQTPVFRQVFWARYVEWMLTIPLVIFTFTLLAGLPWANIVALLVVSEAMTLIGLFAGLQHDHKASTWGWFALACVFLVYFFFHFLWTCRKHAKNQHSYVSSLYTKLSIYIVIVWLVYPFVFALGQGIGIINPNSEIIAYTVLDILGKTGFGIWLLVVHKHDSENAAVCFPESWTEPRGTRRGLIQLPGGDE